MTIAGLITEHIISHIPTPFPSVTGESPLFVGLQGPQGCGKTTVTRALYQALSTKPYNLRIAIISIDDLYYGYETLKAIADSNLGNHLLSGRGQPGTHDVDLGKKILQELQQINSETKKPIVNVPRFDKSKYNGYGDRLDTWDSINGPLDVVLIEGWCFGFYPVSNEELQKRWDGRTQQDVPLSIQLTEGIADIQQINNNLREYVDQWYPFFTCFIQVKAQDISYVYKWRLEQERMMKRTNGGIGMNDDEVCNFIDRYMPGYAFFSDGVRLGFRVGAFNSTEAPPPWSGSGLQVILNEERAVIGSSTF